MSLYLKYRPQVFDDIVDQKYIVDILKAQINLGNINSNYLFFGPRGTGKTTTARIFARALNCEKLQDGNPCNECNSCKLILEGKTMDFVEIDAASHTQVDNIREEIIEKAPYPPTNLKKKVYIIDEVHMLSKAAFNALLKIMEEPPVYLTFILATTEINKVPETIVSRCQVFNFKKLKQEDIVFRLKYISEKEGFSYDEDALYLIAQLSDGALRDAVKYLEQVSILGDINEENVIKFLGVAPQTKISQLIQMLKDIDKEFENLLDFIDQLNSSGIDLSVFAKQVLHYIDINFIKDYIFYAKIAELFKNILLNLKFYPNKVLVYKIEFAKFLDSLNSSKDNIIVKNEEKKEDESSKLSTYLKNQSTKLKANKEKELNNKDLLDNKDSKIDEEQTGKIETDNINFDELKKQLIDKLDSITLKTALKRFADIVSIKNEHVEIVVINKMQEIILKNEENIKKLEKVLSEILGKNIILHINYMSKEDYFKLQMKN